VIYLLDTDHVSALQSVTAAGRTLRERLRSVPADDYGTTVVTYEEQCRGWLDRIHRAQNPVARVAAYADLRDNLKFFSGMAVWEYDAAADALFEQFVSARVRVGTKDLRIGCIALANAATLLTRNTRDFSRIPGLMSADWTV
jgi:tRNA(fMet)-specific endonuclease VapC